MNIKTLFLLTIGICNVACAVTQEETQRASQHSETSGDTSVSGQIFESPLASIKAIEAEQQAKNQQTAFCLQGCCSCIKPAHNITVPQNTDSTPVLSAPHQDTMVKKVIITPLTAMQECVIMTVDNIEYAADKAILDTGQLVQETIKESYNMVKRCTDGIHAVVTLPNGQSCYMPLEYAHLVTQEMINQAKANVIEFDPNEIIEKLEDTFVPIACDVSDQTQIFTDGTNYAIETSKGIISLSKKKMQEILTKAGVISKDAAAILELPSVKQGAKIMISGTAGAALAAVATGIAATLITGGGAIPVIAIAGIGIGTGFVVRQAAIGAINGGEIAARSAVRKLSGKLSSGNAALTGTVIASAAEATDTLPQPQSDSI